MALEINKHKRIKLLYLLLLLSLIKFSWAEEPMGSLMVPEELKASQIEDKAGAMIPLDINMTNHLGQEMMLKNYLLDNKPLILVLGYYSCPMLCSLVLNGLVEGINELSFSVGKDYRVLSISIDPKETFDLAQKKRENYLKTVKQKNISDKDFSFNVAKEEEVKRLAQALGFNYFYDKRTQQYAHGAGVFFLSQKGQLSRTLFGISFNPSDIKLALSDAANGKIGSFIDQIILSCFHYDPDSHRYGVYILGFVRICGIITVLVIGLFLLWFFHNEKKRHIR